MKDQVEELFKLCLASTSTDVDYGSRGHRLIKGSLSSASN